MQSISGHVFVRLLEHRSEIWKSLQETEALENDKGSDQPTCGEHTFQYIKYDIIGASKWYIKPILASRLISADICDISVSAEAILYLRYYWVGPPYIICDIGGWAHLYHIIYAILPGGPTIYNMRYWWVGPSVPYYICDITGWAHHI